MGAEDGIGVPAWTQPPSLSPIEDRIDSALSSANSILNFVLGPVRSFVHAVLHPLFAFADLTLGWVYQVIHWVFVHIPDLASQVRGAVARLWFDTVGLISRAVGDVAGAVGGVTDFVLRIIDSSIAKLTGIVRSWVNDAIHYASAVADGARALITSAINTLTGIVRGWVNDAIHYASQIADAARELIAKAADATLGAAQRLIADALSLARRFADDAFGAAKALISGTFDAARALINTLWHDVVDPLVHRFESFLANEFRWAYNLLKLFEHSAEWIAWLGVHAIPEAIDTFKDIKSLIDLPPGEAARSAAHAFGRRRP